MNKVEILKDNSKARSVDLWGYLATLLTGGALVSFAGSALTFIYFWKIGGVPIGQALGSTSMAKVVLSSTFLLGGLLLMGWLAPVMLFQVCSDDSPFGQRLRQLFSAPENEKVAAVNFNNIVYFALSTVGIGCFSLIFAAFGVGLDDNNNWTWKSYSVCLFIPAFLIGYFLVWKWRSFNKTNDLDHKGKLYPGKNLKKSHLAAWLFIGYSSAVISTFPLLTLLLIFRKSDFLLEKNSYFAFGAGACGISIAILIAYGVSLSVLVQRSKGIAIKWVIVLAVNAFTLLMVVVAFGIASKLLDAVMEISSVRIERAIMMLEPEGCELLESMQATGLRGVGADSRACVLYDVTIQSTLDPAMQVACLREVDPNKKVADSKTWDSNEGVVISGKPGAFTIPSKFVRSIWKTSGVEYKNKMDVCPKKIFAEIK